MKRTVIPEGKCKNQSGIPEVWKRPETASQETDNTGMIPDWPVRNRQTENVNDLTIGYMTSLKKGVDKNCPNKTLAKRQKD